MRKIEYGIKFDGTLIIKYNYDSNEYLDMENWAKNNCNGRICSQNRASDRFFVFTNPEDATAFKLRWLL